MSGHRCGLAIAGPGATSGVVTQRGSRTCGCRGLLSGQRSGLHIGCRGRHLAVCDDRNARYGHPCQAPSAIDQRYSRCPAAVDQRPLTSGTAVDINAVPGRRPATSEPSTHSIACCFRGLQASSCTSRGTSAPSRRARPPVSTRASPSFSFSSVVAPVFPSQSMSLSTLPSDPSLLPSTSMPQPPHASGLAL